MNTGDVKDMQTLLEDVELDVQELKVLMQAVASDANPALRALAKRNIMQMHTRLDQLLQLLNDSPAVAESVVVAPAVQESVDSSVVSSTQELIAPLIATLSPQEPVALSESITLPVSSILAERIKPAIDLRRAISLNDSFRFTRELFAGDAGRMNEVVRQLGKSVSLEQALELFATTVQVEEDNEAASDFVELLKKYFS